MLTLLPGQARALSFRAKRTTNNLSGRRKRFFSTQAPGGDKKQGDGAQSGFKQGAEGASKFAKKAGDEKSGALDQKRKATESRFSGMGWRKPSTNQSRRDATYDVLRGSASQQEQKPGSEALKMPTEEPNRFEDRSVDDVRRAREEVSRFRGSKPSQVPVGSRIDAPVGTVKNREGEDRTLEGESEQDSSTRPSGSEGTKSRGGFDNRGGFNNRGGFDRRGQGIARGGGRGGGGGGGRGGARGGFQRSDRDTELQLQQQLQTPLKQSQLESGIRGSAFGAGGAGGAGRGGTRPLPISSPYLQGGARRGGASRPPGRRRETDEDEDEESGPGSFMRKRTPGLNLFGSNVDEDEEMLARSVQRRRRGGDEEDYEEDEEFEGMNRPRNMRSINETVLIDPALRGIRDIRNVDDEGEDRLLGSNPLHRDVDEDTRHLVQRIEEQRRRAALGEEDEEEEVEQLDAMGEMDMGEDELEWGSGMFDEEMGEGADVFARFYEEDGEEGTFFNELGDLEERPSKQRKSALDAQWEDEWASTPGLQDLLIQKRLNQMSGEERMNALQDLIQRLIAMKEEEAKKTAEKAGIPIEEAAPAAFAESSFSQLVKSLEKAEEELDESKLAELEEANEDLTALELDEQEMKDFDIRQLDPHLIDKLMDLEKMDMEKIKSIAPDLQEADLQLLSRLNVLLNSDNPKEELQNMLTEVGGNINEVMSRQEIAMLDSLSDTSLIQVAERIVSQPEDNIELPSRTPSDEADARLSRTSTSTFTDLEFLRLQQHLIQERLHFISKERQLLQLLKDEEEMANEGGAGEGEGSVFSGGQKERDNAEYDAKSEQFGGQRHLADETPEDTAEAAARAEQKSAEVQDEEPHISLDEYRKFVTESKATATTTTTSSTSTPPTTSSTKATPTQPAAAVETTKNSSLDAELEDEGDSDPITLLDDEETELTAKLHEIQRQLTEIDPSGKSTQDFLADYDDRRAIPAKNVKSALRAMLVELEHSKATETKYLAELTSKLDALASSSRDKTFAADLKRRREEAFARFQQELQEKRKAQLSSDPVQRQTQLAEVIQATMDAQQESVRKGAALLHKLDSVTQEWSHLRTTSADPLENMMNSAMMGVKKQENMLLDAQRAMKEKLESDPELMKSVPPEMQEWMERLRTTPVPQSALDMLGMMDPSGNQFLTDLEDLDLPGFREALNSPALLSAEDTDPEAQEAIEEVRKQFDKMMSNLSKLSDSTPFEQGFLKQVELMSRVSGLNDPESKRAMRRLPIVRALRPRSKASKLMNRQLLKEQSRIRKDLKEILLKREKGSNSTFAAREAALAAAAAARNSAVEAESDASLMLSEEEIAEKLSRPDTFESIPSTQLNRDIQSWLTLALETEAQNAKLFVDLLGGGLDDGDAPSFVRRLPRGSKLPPKARLSSMNLSDLAEKEAAAARTRMRQKLRTIPELEDVNPDEFDEDAFVESLEESMVFDDKVDEMLLTSPETDALGESTFELDDEELWDSTVPNPDEVGLSAKALRYKREQEQLHPDHMTPQARADKLAEARPLHVSDREEATELNDVLNFKPIHKKKLYRKHIEPALLDPSLLRTVTAGIDAGKMEIDDEDLEEAFGLDNAVSEEEMRDEQEIMDNQFNPSSQGLNDLEIALHSEKGMVHGIVEIFDRVLTERKRRMLIKANAQKRFEIWRAESWSKREKRMEAKNARQRQQKKEAGQQWEKNRTDPNMVYYPEFQLWIGKDELRNDVFRNAVSSALANPSWQLKQKRDFVLGVRRDLARLAEPMPAERQRLIDTVFALPKKPKVDDLRTVEHMLPLPVTDWSLLIAQAERAMDPAERVRRFEPSPLEKSGGLKKQL